VVCWEHSTKPPLFKMDQNNIYHHEVQYRWSTKRGSALINHYKNGYAISRYTSPEDITKDNVNYAFAIQQLGLKGKKIVRLEVMKVYESKVVGQAT
jgi:hypothetical protein